MINLQLEVIFGTFFTALLAVFGFLGKSFLSRLQSDLLDYKKEIEALTDKVTENNDTLIRIATTYEEVSKHVDNLTVRLNEVEKEIVRQERDSKSLYNTVRELKQNPKNPTIY